MTPLTRFRTPLLLAAAAMVAVLLYGLQDRSSQLAVAVNQISAQVGDLMGLAKVHDQVITERVIDLPEDGQSWSSVFVWPDNREADPESRRLAALFASEPRLQSLLAQTKSFHYRPQDPLFRERFAGTIGAVTTPSYWLIQPGNNPSQGTSVYTVDRSRIPADGRVMADGIAAAIGRICPRPKPPVTPPVTPPVPVPPAIPDLGPPVEPIDDSLPLWMWILPVVAAGAGALNEWRRG